MRKYYSNSIEENKNSEREQQRLVHHLEYLLHAIEWIHDTTIQSPATNLFLMHTFFL